ncbi:MAG: thioredoxin family protein [Bacteroidales bacterium]|nr:thioredoxin family protein [Bacteroidales bacterium]
MQTEIKDISKTINNSAALMIYYFNPGCVACNGLRPKVEKMVSEMFPEIKILSVDASAKPELAFSTGVYSAPTILVFFEGREYIRESRYISVQELEAKISRYYYMLFS